MATTVQVNRFSTEKDLQEEVCKLIAQKSTLSIEDHGFFTIALSGGSSAKIVCSGLTHQAIDFSKWKVLFCDERYVPLSDENSNYKLAKEFLLDKTSISEENVVALNPSLSLEESAKDYEQKLKSLHPKSTGVPSLDLLVLGMGPDGHICSLFPGHSLLDETDQLVASLADSPKPPPCRITLTYPVINNAKCAVFVTTGSSKAEMVQRALEGNEENPVPAARVKLLNGHVYWFLDDGSASLLKK